jgi:hypothetical protein
MYVRRQTNKVAHYIARDHLYLILVPISIMMHSIFLLVII